MAANILDLFDCSFGFAIIGKESDFSREWCDLRVCSMDLDGKMMMLSLS